MNDQHCHEGRSLEILIGHRCADPACATCGLLEMPPEGPARDAWVADIRAQLAAAPSLYGRSRRRGEMVIPWNEEKAS